MVAWWLGLTGAAVAQGGGPAVLVPMDNLQTDHCRAYGLVYRLLQKQVPNIYWLLNYRGGSFLMPDDEGVIDGAKRAGVLTERLSADEVGGILALITEENMDVVPLEMAPRIGIYLPAAERGDVVAQLLIYAGIPYQTIYDDGILKGKLADFDWIHIHHKDFTGQGHKQLMNTEDEALARSLGFAKVWLMKQQVARTLRDYVAGGGFVFAMCSAAETVDIALAAQGVDIVPAPFDGDPADPEANQKLNYDNTFAFTDFTVLTDSLSEYSDIDVTGAGRGSTFSLFPFSAQVDPIPCLLNQDHSQVVRGFDGETTSFRKSLVKKNAVILGENSDGVSVRYLMGYHGKGFFSFYGGHTPGRTEEDYRAQAPGFRLILNNVLFPSAKVKKRKT
ncbi:MAG: asparagine synthetase B [Candidatus Riflebacteria bacterium]|nr:asparagine synthetase B [Candidatus Riflebacteria bacterium]